MNCKECKNRIVTGRYWASGVETNRCEKNIREGEFTTKIFSPMKSE